VILVRDGSGTDYSCHCDVTALENVAQHTRVLDEAHMAGSNDISEAFLDYVAPLVGNMPYLGRLSDYPVPKRLG
jgi:6-phosphofructokinase 1